MAAERPARDDILTTITPAQRVPSIGTQLTMAEPLPPLSYGERTGSAPRAIPARPQALSLWDTDADAGIPDTWRL